MPHATDRIEVPDLGIVELPTFVTRGFARAYGHMVTGAFFDVSGVSHRAEGVIDAFCLVTGFDPTNREHRDEVALYLSDVFDELTDELAEHDDDITYDLCRHCRDSIVLSASGMWVDVNGLSSCAPLADAHEPIRRGT